MHCQGRAIWKAQGGRRGGVTITATRIMAAFCHCAAILSRLLLRLLLAANARLIAVTVETKIHVPPTSVSSIYLSLSLSLSVSISLSVFLCTLESSGNGNCVNKVSTAAAPPLPLVEELFEIQLPLQLHSVLSSP